MWHEEGYVLYRFPVGPAEPDVIATRLRDAGFDIKGAGITGRELNEKGQAIIDKETRRPKPAIPFFFVVTTELPDSEKQRTADLVKAP